MVNILCEKIITRDLGYSVRRRILIPGFFVVFFIVFTVIAILLSRKGVVIIALLLFDTLIFSLSAKAIISERKQKKHISKKKYAVENHECCSKHAEAGANEYRRTYSINLGLGFPVGISKKEYQETKIGVEFYTVFLNGDCDPALIYNKRYWIMEHELKNVKNV